MQSILSITHYEFIMHWRRRGLRVLALTMLVVTLAGIIILQSAPDGQITQLLNLNGESFTTSTLLTFLTFPALISLIGFVFPVIASESVPIDRQLKTYELINSLPVTQGEYLAGKVLGFVTAGLATIAAGTIITSVAWWLSIGSYDIANYVELWLVSGVVLVMNCGIAILIGATQPNRIRAAAVVICGLIVSAILLSNNTTAPTLVNALNLSRVSIITYYVNHPTETGFTRLFSPDVSLAIVAGMTELVILFAALWAWRQRTE